MLRAFAAATSDLKPGGRLPKGLTAEQATRACVAFAAVSLDRFATAGEKMLAVLEDTEPEPEGGWQDEPAEPLQVDHPGMPEIPAGQMNPEKIAALIEEQDQETCRKFAIEFLSWMWGLEDLDHRELLQDLESSEASILETVRDCYRAALKLDEPEGGLVAPTVAPGNDAGNDDDQADDEQGTDADREGGAGGEA
jgi:hypothetical protein